jgi:hypothetical protein
VRTGGHQADSVHMALVLLSAGTRACHPYSENDAEDEASQSNDKDEVEIDIDHFFTP